MISSGSGVSGNRCSCIRETDDPKSRKGTRADNNFDIVYFERKYNVPAWFLGHECSGDDGPGDRIRKIRVQKSLTITELAEMINMSPVTIMNIEAGRNPSIVTLRKLSSVLNVPIAYIGKFEKMPENNLGQKIQKARFYHGLMVNELAQQLGVNPHTLISWEKNRHMPSFDYIKRLDTYFQEMANINSFLLRQ